jgi:hypothetical protein
MGHTVNREEIALGRAMLAPLGGEAGRG